jgi:hypothetical protein
MKFCFTHMCFANDQSTDDDGLSVCEWSYLSGAYESERCDIGWAGVTRKVGP